MRTDGHPDSGIYGQRYIRTYIYPPLDKRYSPIISSICGPNNLKMTVESAEIWKCSNLNLDQFLYNIELGTRIIARKLNQYSALIIEETMRKTSQLYIYIHIYYHYKRAKLLLTVIYGSPRRNSNSSKTFEKLEIFFFPLF